MASVLSDVDRTRRDFLPWWRTSIDEEDIRRLLDAVRAEHISMGAITAQFEAELSTVLDIPFVVATTSGSVALTLAMMALDIGPGDEVIVPDRTFIATAHAAHMLGAKIVLADCKRDYPNVNPQEISAGITTRTKAIIVVHLNGRCCEMDEILAIAGRHGIPVVEDAAQALLSRSPGGYMGGIGRIGCFSFGMTKLISTGQGGAVVTRDKALHEKLRAMRNHGVGDVVSHEYLMSGNNFKFTDMQAAVGLGQLHRWRDKLHRCKLIHETYRDGLAGLNAVALLNVRTDEGECALWAEAASMQRDELIAWLNQRGIQTRRFLPSLSSAPHLSTATDFPNSAAFERTGFILPSGPSQSLDNVQRTISAVRDWSARG